MDRHGRTQVIKNDLGPTKSGGSATGGTPLLPNLKSFRESALQEAEHSYLEGLISISRSNIGEACRISGLSRARLYVLMRKHRVPRRG